MTQINEIYLAHMNNGAHFTFVENIMSRIKADAKIQEKFGGLVDALRAAFEEEDRLLRNMTRKNIKTEDITKYDSERDRLYRCLRNAVKVFLDTEMDEYAGHARVLWLLIDDYGIDTRAQMDKESGLLTNLIGDLEAKHAADLEPLSLTALVARLKEANEQVKSLMRSRTDDGRGVETGALRAARFVTDEAYRKLVTTVNAHAIVEGDEAYAHFIDGVNLDIKKFKRDVLGQKGGSTSTSKPTGGSEEKPGTGGTENPGGSGNTGSGGEENPGSGGDHTDFE